MKIIAVNGSPKMTGSLTERVIEEMERLLETNISVQHAGKLVKGPTPPDSMEEILAADTLLLIFPLYCDALPASVVELLTRLEAAARGREHTPRLFAIVNCGFYEASQNATALAICKHFADRADFPWGYGLGIGGGPPLADYSSWEKGPAARIYRALRDISTAVLAGKSGADVFVSPGIPRFVYLLGAKLHMRSVARKSGTKNPRAQPYSAGGTGNLL